VEIEYGEIDYCAITAAGNGQTVVVKSTARNRWPTVATRLSPLYTVACYLVRTLLRRANQGKTRERAVFDMSTTTDQHRAEAPQQIRCAVITVSDTRTLDTDRGGDTLIELLTAAGHTLVDRQIVPDEPRSMRTAVESLVARHPSLGTSSTEPVDAILMTGGTGIGSRDQTFETISALLTKTLPGYGELFRMLSYEEIGAAAMLSRAIGGLVDRTVLLTMPGSPAAVRLAMQKVILPELGHLVREASK